MSLSERGVTPEFEKTPESLDALQEHFVLLYGRRSQIWLPGRAPRIDLLSVGLGDLQDAIRKDVPQSHLEVMFARVVARICGITQAVNNVSVACAMVEKFPMSGCSYCHNLPCTCSESRPDPQLGLGADQIQLSWMLGDWQKHLDKLYGDKNRERGIENVLNRLFKEVAELLNLEREIPKIGENGHSVEQVEHEFALELSDCLAWVIAAANITGVDLEKSTLERFWPTCWNCGQKPCLGCRNFNFEQVKGVVTSPRN